MTALQVTSSGRPLQDAPGNLGCKAGEGWSNLGLNPALFKEEDVSSKVNPEGVKVVLRDILQKIVQCEAPVKPTSAFITGKISVEKMENVKIFKKLGERNSEGKKRMVPAVEYVPIVGDTSADGSNISFL
ncbi:hypothetical protein ACOSQ2_019617 [Xanthoceras sorbifolium]